MEWSLCYLVLMMALNLVTTFSGFKNYQIVRWELAKRKLEE
jgi:hypothetical protein